MAAARLTPLLAALALAAAAVAGDGPELAWHALGDGGRQGELRVEGLPGERLARLGAGAVDAELGARLLRVVAASSDDAASDDLPNLWGTYRVEEATLVFRPRHALGSGVTLVARFDGAAFDRATGGAGTPSRALRVPIAARNGPPTRVVAVAPGGDEVPENLLRLYVEFSAPMSVRGVERHVALLDADGSAIEGAFVEVPNGLWDPTRTRLTLLLHPGRVKRGLAAHEALGPPLREGHTVRLVVRRAARDADGRELAAAFERRYRVGPAVRSAIDPSRWTLAPPRAADAPLAVRFDRPLDRALAARALRVVDARGVPLEGSVEIEPGERGATLRGAAPWRDGERYRLIVDPVLEDACGNRLGAAFERAAEASAPASAAALEFTARLGSPAG